MTSANMYRSQLDYLRTNLASGVDKIDGLGVNANAYNDLLSAVGVERESDKAREARLELEAFTLKVQQATRSFLPRGSRNKALKALGFPVPLGRVGKLNTETLIDPDADEEDFSY